jgi:hypothetical protein
MTNQLSGLGRISIKDFNPKEMGLISLVVEKALKDLAPGVSPAEDDQEIWIDVRCTQEEFDLVKVEIEKSLKPLAPTRGVFSFSDKD